VTDSLSWILGRGGLLGRNVEASLLRGGPHAQVWHPRNRIRWDDTKLAVADFECELDRFFAHAARSRRTWRLLWCAGVGVIATSAEALAQETSIVTRFVAAVADALADDLSLAPRGMLFFASSAGGAYAASPAPPPFDEDAPVAALAPYGQEKLIQEELFEGMAEASGVELLIGRLSNLYGPGQNVSKPQGLVGHVGYAALRREPVSIYVPLDTIRDYLFAADAGRMVVEAIEQRDARRAQGAPQESTTKIFASEVETTVALVLRAWRQALRHPLRVALAASPVGLLQPRVLSFRSRVWPEVRRQPTALPLGVEAVRRDQLARLMAIGVG
jgi:UDP-glucose 4-epimerase